MKLIVFLILFSVVGLFASNSYSQTKLINLNMNNTSVKGVLLNIEEQSDFHFMYSEKIIDINRKVSIKAINKNVTEILDNLFAGTGVDYKVKDRFILLSNTEVDATKLFVMQQNSVKGKVTDENGEPLPGVTIVIKGTTNGTITDINGNYTIANIPTGATLQFSFVGMTTQDIVVSKQSVINVKMKADAIGIDEVVAIGYGIMKKSDLTGSVSSVNQENLENIPVSSVDQKLIGQVAGVQIQQVSGIPRGGTSIKIRGSGSIGAGNEPLYVIDGMPYSSDMNQNINPLAFINPNDIESISILKDASSTAIYGSRGSNGVIMITTKRGSYGQTTINVSSMYGVQQVPQKGRPDMMNQREFAEMERDRIDALVRFRANREPVLSDYPLEYQDLDALTGRGTDWYDLILQTASIQDHTINVNKGTKDSRLNFSMGYYKQDGVIKYTGMKRFTGKLSMESNIGNFVKIGASLEPTFIKQDRTKTNSSRADLLGISIWGNPVMTPYDSDGELIPYINSPKSQYLSAWSFVNPLFALRETTQQQQNFQNLGIAYIEWDILSGLKAKSSISTNYGSGKYFYYKPGTVGGTNTEPSGTGLSNSNRSDRFNWLIENMLSYKKVINKHKFNAVVGYTTQKDKSTNINLTADPYPNDLIKTINAAQDITSWDENSNEWSMISYLGRLNYSYKDKYLFTTTFRSDGSSRFGKNKRFAFFPSMAAAWRISEEKFMKDNQLIDNLKLRLSYGKSGNNNIGNYSHLGVINAGSYIFGNNQVTASNVGISNSDLTWEESNQYDAGIDIGLLENRLSLVIDYYNRKSENMLLTDIIPAITGFNSQIVNKGSVRNTGVEIAFGGTPIAGNLFNWDINFNISFNKNKVLSLNENGDRIFGGYADGANRTNVTVVGKPIGQLFGFVLEGLYTAEDMLDPTVAKYSTASEGQPKYTDINEDGTITDMLDYTIIGDPHPDFIYGITNNFSYKNIDLCIIVNGQYGGDVINGLRTTTDNLQAYFNVSKEWVNRWRSPEQPGDGMHYGVPVLCPSLGHRMSTLWIEDATYLRISNLTLGYSLPKRCVKKTGFITGCKLNLTVKNLVTFTKYSGANPEGQIGSYSNTLSPGYDMTSYPLSRIVSFGINFTF